MGRKKKRKNNGSDSDYNIWDDMYGEKNDDLGGANKASVESVRPKRARTPYSRDSQHGTNLEVNEVYTTVIPTDHFYSDLIVYSPLPEDDSHIVIRFDLPPQVAVVRDEYTTDLEY